MLFVLYCVLVGIILYVEGKFLWGILLELICELGMNVL